MKTPWHLWVIGILALLWNAGGAYDYILIKTRNADYFAAMTAQHIAYLDAFPLWVGMAWALGVWGRWWVPFYCCCNPGLQAPPLPFPWSA